MKEYENRINNGERSLIPKYNKCKNLFYHMYHNKLDKIYAKKYSVRNAIVKGLKNKTLPVAVYNLLISVPAKLWKNALDEVISNLKSNWSNLKNTIKEKIKNNVSPYL